MLFAYLTVGLLSLLISIFAFSPIGTIISYVLTRPLVQPYASLGYTFAGTTIPLTAIFPVLLIAIAFCNFITRKNFPIVTINILPLYVLVYFSIISLLATQSYIISIGHILKLLAAISAYILVFNGVRTIKDIDHILWAFLVSSIIPMIYGFYQFATRTGHAWKGAYYAGRRIDSLLMEYNAYGEFLCLVICACMILIFRYNRLKIRFILVFCLLSLLTSLVLSLNRGSWICILFALLFAAFFYREEINIPLIFGLCFLCILAASPLIYQRFMELTVVTKFGSKNTLLGRIEGWKLLMPIISQNLFIGTGIGGIQLKIAQELGYTYVPHNDYIRLAAEGGIIAFLSYVSFILINLYQNITSKARYALWQINFPVSVAVIYFASLSLFQNIVYNVVVFPMFAVLLAIAHKANRLISNEIISTEEYAVT